LSMNRLRIGLLCALIGWMAADAQAQMGTYGSPDLIPMGQYAPQNPYAPAVANRGPYVNVADGSGPTLAPVPAPAPGIPLPPSESSAVSSMLHEPNATVSPSSGCAVMPSGGYIKEPGNCETCGNGCVGCGGGCCSPWYFSADALYMTRSKPNTVYTSAEANSLVNQGYFNDVSWTWGAQATVGYRFGCCCEWAVEATYWGLTEGNSC